MSEKSNSYQQNNCASKSNADSKSASNSSKGLKVYLETYGCQMNEYDSELVQSIMESNNYSFVNEPFSADIIMLNTCTIRSHANDKVINRVHRLRHELKAKEVFIGILGCMASDMKDSLLEDRKLKIDFVVGPDSYKKLPDILEKLLSKKIKESDYELSSIETYSNLFPVRKKGINAWVAVMRGCDNFCSYCIVPYVRGRERSRTIESITDEIKSLTREGFRQVTLLGQNVNSYSYDNKDFSDLLLKVSEIELIKRIRFMTSHPKDFPEKLLDTIAGNEKICKHIHLPLQSGNDRILKLMNRGYSSKDYLKLIESIRSKLPDVVLSTDIIAGFPSESQTEFQETYNLMKTVEFDFAFIFKYSERTGTNAAKNYKDDISEEEKSLRLVKLNELQNEVSLKRNKANIGKTQEILIEMDFTKKSKTDVQGRNDGSKIVICPNRGFKAGDFVKVKIIDATSKVLIAG